MSATSNKPRIPQDSFKIIGAPGEQLVRNFDKEETRNDSITIMDLRRMINNDGQMQMLWNAIQTTIMSAGFSIIDDEDFLAENPDEVSPEKEFIEKIFTKSSKKGGMGTPWDVTTRTFLRALIEGFICFEVVYKRLPDGSIGLEGVEPRVALNSEKDVMIIVRDNGKYSGFHQRTNFGGKIVDVSVTNTSPILKTVKATYGREFGSNYGRSAFRGLWYHYDKAHKNMFLGHIGSELGVTKYAVLKVLDIATVEETDQVMSFLNRRGSESTISLPSDKFEIEFEDMVNAEVMKVGFEYVKLHYSTMAKGLLAQFIDLGSVTGGTGSRSLAEDQIEFFINGLKTISETIIDDTWNQVIDSLVIANFNNGIYPSYKTNPIGNDAAESLFTAFNELIKKDEVTDQVKKQIIQKGGDELGLEIDETLLDQEFEENAIDSQPPIVEEEVGLHDHSHSLELAENRELFPDEEKVNLTLIEKELTSKEKATQSAAILIVERDKQTTINRYVRAWKSGSVSKIGDTSIKLAEDDQTLEQLLLAFANEVHNFGKVQAANEINAAISTTSKRERSKLIEKVKSTIDKLDVDLSYRLAQITINALNKQQGADEDTLRRDLNTDYNAFWSSLLTTTILTLSGTSFNFGRQFSFRENQGKIIAYRYTAILDSRTTKFCRSMDGRVFKKSDPNVFQYEPPNHFNCRSLYTAITEDDGEIVLPQGKPPIPSPVASLNTFTDKDVKLSDNEIAKIEIDQMLDILDGTG